MKKQLNLLYRYEDIHYSRGVDTFGDEVPGSDIQLVLYKFRIVKETLKGVWISFGLVSNNRDKFVLLGAHKKYACLTKKEALESYVKRKQRQIEILSNQLHDAQTALSLADTIKI